jgi:hypothetical protein
MQWRKLGIVFRPDTARPWSRSHAMLPTPLAMEDRGVIRVFYTGCDEQGRGRPSWVDVDLEDPRRVVGAGTHPLLDVGEPGCFDDNGAVATSVVRARDGRLFMYYVGFELGVNVRYRLLTGLAVSDDGGDTFARHATTPILERSPEELLFRCGPYVLAGEDGFRMWYVSGSRWTEVDGKAMPEYRIVEATSSDGIAWPRAGRTCIDITDPDEHGFGRPWVVHEGGRYRMYYSVRRRSLRAYRMGFAESADGREWNRDDARMNLGAGPERYDDAAIMYAATIEAAGRTWCFYNGNDFGREGFALAVREQA